MRKKQSKSLHLNTWFLLCSQNIEGWLKIYLWLITRFGWIYPGMIVTFSTSSYGWLSLWPQTKIPKKNTAGVILFVVSKYLECLYTSTSLGYKTLIPIQLVVLLQHIIVLPSGALPSRDARRRENWRKFYVELQRFRKLMPSPLYLQYLTTAHGFYFNFSISTSWLHMLGGGGIVGT